jgi:hypothetical protein
MKLFNIDGKYSAETFTAYDRIGYGVYLSSGDIDEDGNAEIVTGQGPDPMNRSIVRIFKENGLLIREFQAYPDDTKYGVRISVGGVGGVNQP